MRWCVLAKTIIDAYYRLLAEPVDFWPKFADELRNEVTAEQAQVQCDADREAAWAQYRRDHPADAPSDQTTEVRQRCAGLGRGVTYVGKLTAPAASDASASAAPAKSGAAASR